LKIKSREFEAETEVSGENEKNPVQVSHAFAHYSISSEVASASTLFPGK